MQHTAIVFWQVTWTAMACRFVWKSSFLSGIDEFIKIAVPQWAIRLISDAKFWYREKPLNVTLLLSFRNVCCKQITDRCMQDKSTFNSSLLACSPVCWIAKHRHLPIKIIHYRKFHRSPTHHTCFAGQLDSARKLVLVVFWLLVQMNYRTFSNCGNLVWFSVWSCWSCVTRITGFWLRRGLCLFSFSFIRWWTEMIYLSGLISWRFLEALVLSERLAK